MTHSPDHQQRQTTQPVSLSWSYRVRLPARGTYGAGQRARPGLSGAA